MLGIDFFVENTFKFREKKTKRWIYTWVFPGKWWETPQSPHPNGWSFLVGKTQWLLGKPTIVGNPQIGLNDSSVKVNDDFLAKSAYLRVASVAAPLR